ncbi:MAG: isochorismatase family protein [Desulfovibrio sp.]|nr:isochorismatase family protein [Desulfovibrio sp.]
MQRLLLVVDPQVDFITGSLPVPGAEAAMNALASALHGAGPVYAAKIVSADHHPYDHCSFREEGGEWPRHCVADTVGAALWPALVPALYETPGPCRVLHKGRERGREEYSLFQDPVACERVLATVERLGVTRVEICGLAGDICVLATLRDGVKLLGPGIFAVLPAYSPSLDGGTALAAYAAEAGIALVDAPGVD